jgi:hypothetical protein
MEKLDIQEESGDEVKSKEQAGIERQFQDLALEAIEGVVGGFGPKEEGQHDVAYLDCGDQADRPLDPGIVQHYVYFGHDDAEEVLDALTQVEGGVEEEEAHAAAVRQEDPAQNEARQREGRVEQEEEFVGSLCSDFFELLLRGCSHRLVYILSCSEDGVNVYQI